MKSEIILYGKHVFFLDVTHDFLKTNGFAKTHRIISISNPDEIEKAVTTNTDVLILNLLGENIAEATDNIEKLLLIKKNLKIIVLSINSELKMIKRFFDKGVKSYLGKNTNNIEFLQALHHVMDGKVYISEDAKNELFNFICSGDENEKKVSGIDELTAREMDVLTLVCEGLRTKEIAEKLFISTHTVESHRRNIMMKLNINNSSKLVKFAVDHSLVK